MAARKSAPGSVMRLSTRSMYSAVRAPGFTPGNESALLLQVLRQIDRVEDDRRVEVGEEQDQERVERRSTASVPGAKQSATSLSQPRCSKKRRPCPAR